MTSPVESELFNSPEALLRPLDIRRGKCPIFPMCEGMNPWNMTDAQLAEHLQTNHIKLYDDPERPGKWVINQYQAESMGNMPVICLNEDIYGRDPNDPYGERHTPWESDPSFPGNDRPVLEE